MEKMKKVLSLFLCVAMCIGLLPLPTAFATADDYKTNGEGVLDEAHETFRDDIEKDLTADTIDDVTDNEYDVASPELVYYSTLEEMGSALRVQLKNRIANCVVGFVGENSPDEADVWAEALKHTGVPDEGDYLKSCIDYQAYLENDIGYIDYRYDIECDTVYDDDGIPYKCYTYKNVKYRTTVAQERAVDEAVDILKSEIRSDNINNTLFDIFDHVKNIPYDNYHLKQDPEYVLEQTAYGALILGTAVCEGFAQLFYRLALEFGIDARMVVGEYSEGAHAWNRVRVSPNTAYYTVDPTNNIYMVGYTEEYELYENANEKGFEAKYPLSRSSYVLSMDYSFDQDTGTLTINGTGVLPDVYERNVYLRDQQSTYPWSDSIRMHTKKIVFSNGITSIGNGLFKDFSAEQLELPDSLVNIGDKAFYMCDDLVAVSIPDSVQKIGNAAFRHTDNLSRFDISDESQLSEFGEEVFEWSNIGSLRIPKRVKSIPDGLCDGCKSLENVTIDGTIETIGERAFYDCRTLNTVNFPHNSKLRSIGARAFNGCNALESFELPEGLVKLGEKAFASCAIKKVNLPESLTVIPDGAFQECSITNIVIPESVVYIGTESFMGQNTNTFFVPENVAYIGENAFNSYALESITVSSKNKYYCSVAGVLFDKSMTRMMCFPGAKPVNEYAIPEGVRSIDTGAFMWSDRLSHIFIPSTLDGSVEPIMNNYNLREIDVSENNPAYRSADGVLFSKDMTKLIKFPRQKRMEEYSIPDGVTEIGAGAFDGIFINSVSIPDSVKIIGESAFRYSNIKEIVIPDSVISIGQYAFRYSKLEKASVGQSVKKLLHGTFMQCDSLKEVYLKTGLTEIVSHCFDDCNSLKKIVYSGSSEQWNSIIKGAYNGIDNVEIICTGSDEPIDTADKIKIGFDANGGAVDENGKEVEKGAQYGQLPTPIREGFEFFGWFTSPEGGVQITSETKMLANDDHTLYAHWDNTVSASGTDGKENNIIWTLHNNGELVFYGYGELSREGDAKWLDIRKQVTSVTISGAINKIGESGLGFLINATDIRFESKVEEIGDLAFALWTSVQSLVLPEGIKSIGSNCFYGCSSLEHISLPDSLEIIGDSAFGCKTATEGFTIITSCQALESITIPKNVKEIGNYAFSRSGVKTVKDLSNCSWGVQVFAKCTRLTNASVNDVGYEMFADCNALTTATVNSGKVGAYAFSFCSSLKAVTIKEGCTEIGESAFRGCSSLETVDIPESVVFWGIDIFHFATSLKTAKINSHITKLPDYIFYGCTSLEKVILPETLLNVGSRSFYGCTALTDIGLPESIKYIGENAFENCSSLENILLPAGLKSIGGNAFCGCEKLQSISIPQGVEKISPKAFSDCSALESVRMYDTINEIKDEAFNRCTSINAVYWMGDEEKWQSVTIGRSNDTLISAQLICNPNYRNVKVSLEANGGSVPCSEITVIYGIKYGALPTPERENYRFSGWYTSKTGGRRISDTSDVTNGRPHTLYAHWSQITHEGSCGNNAEWVFYDDGTLVLSGNGDMAFSGEIAWKSFNNEILNVIVQEGITSIGEAAFSDCMNLRSVNLADSVKTIGNYAFKNCYSLTEANLGDRVTSIGDYAFKNCRSLVSARLGNVISIGNYAFDNCESLAHVELCDMLAEIGEHAFSNSNVKSIEFPDAVETIGAGAFENCILLSKVSMPKSIEIISDCLFNGCKSLTSVYIPDGVESIGKDAFCRCEMLTEITLPNTISSIGEGAFLYSGLTSIAIPSGVKTICDRAFDDCKNLEKATLPDELEKIGQFAFFGTAIKTITVPDSVVEIGRDAFRSCKQLESIKLSNSITVLSSTLFWGCSSLKSVEIPDGVTVINDSFRECSALENVSLPESLERIESYAFEGCTSLRYIHIPDKVWGIGNGAFAGCSSLQSITIPEKTIYLQNSVFENCESLKEIVFLGEPCFRGKDQFDGVTATVYYPDQYKDGNSKWSDSVFLDYGGKITWHSWYTIGSIQNHEHTFTSNDDKDGCLNYTLHTCNCGFSYRENYIYVHSVVKDSAIEPTCTKSGLTEGSHCSLCDKCLVEQDELAPLGHDCVHHDAKEPTCTEKGWEAYDTCTRCNYTTYEEIAATGHHYTDTVTAPTCTEKGYTTHTCTCGDSYVDSYVDATGHSFGEWTQTKAPTCTAKGTESRTCANCGKTETREIAALDHNLVHHDGKAATCTEKGWAAYDTCSRCDYSTYKEIAATGHHYTAKVIAPTCTVKGHTIYTCACGDGYISDYVDALGHDRVHHDGKAATCTEKGWAAYDTCSCCDYSTYKEVAALGHSFGAWTQTKAPTCTASGTESRTCANCGKTETREIAALDHNLVHHDGKAATCTEVGWEAYDTCSRCDYSTYKEIGATGHHYTTKVVAPTCTVKGHTIYTCTCGDSYISDYVDALGHNRIHHDAKAPTCTEVGWEAYDTCSRCDYSTYKEIAATGHHYTEKVTAPTCTAKGYTTHSCACGNSYVDNYTNALGHSYKNGVCTRCNAKDPNYVTAPVIKITTSAGKPKISWSAVDGATKYYIYRSTDGKTYKQYTTTTKTSYADSNAKIGTTYYYKVKAAKVLNGKTVYSAYSNVKSIKCTPAAPVVSISRSNGKPKLTWKAVTGASKYYIYRSTDGKTYKQYTTTTKTTYTNTGAASGKKYYYKVKAVAVVNNKNVFSAYSTAKNLMTTIATPTVSITTVNGKPKVSWKAVTGADKYIVYRSTDGKTFKQLSTTTKTSLTNTGAKKNTKYYYKVKAVCTKNTSANSALSKAVSIKATK